MFDVITYDVVGASPLAWISDSSIREDFVAAFSSSDSDMNASFRLVFLMVSFSF
jgi:hypothetical protein